MSSMSQNKHVSNNDIERYESSIHKNEPVFSVNVNVVHHNIASFVNTDPGCHFDRYDSNTRSRKYS